MARGINKVILVGNLGNDPDVKATQGGTTITTISVATSEQWKDKQTGQAQERTEWHRVKFFGKLAEIAGEYLRKGSQCYVEGSIRYDKFTGQDGQDRYITEIVADEMQMLGGRAGGGGGGGEGYADRGERPQRSAPPRRDFAPRGGAPAAAAAAPQAGGGFTDDFADDDIPF